MDNDQTIYTPSEKDRKMVQMMSAFGLDLDVIAGLLGTTEKMVALHYRRELDVGTGLMVAQVAQKLYQKAMDGDSSSIQFILRTRGGWTEKKVTEVQHTFQDPSDPSIHRRLDELLGRAQQRAELPRPEVQVTVPGNSL